jgi:hypothetical protein
MRDVVHTEKSSPRSGHIASLRGDDTGPENDDRVRAADMAVWDPFDL